MRSECVIGISWKDWRRS